MKNILNHILDYPALPVYYNDDAATCIEVVRACYQGGIRVFEFVNRGEKGLENFKVLQQYRDENLPGLKLGIGTIKDVATARQFIKEGADFLVSPVMKPEIADITLNEGMLWIPGCMTPTEISQAEDAGAPLVKLFPGDTLGPGFLKSIKPLFPGMLFMPTGGVSPQQENIANWFKAGVSAVGLGSKLFEKPDGVQGYGWLAERTRSLMSWLPVR